MKNSFILLVPVFVLSFSGCGSSNPLPLPVTQSTVTPVYQGDTAVDEHGRCSSRFGDDYLNLHANIIAIKYEYQILGSDPTPDERAGFREEASREKSVCDEFFKKYTRKDTPELKCTYHHQDATSGAEIDDAVDTEENRKACDQLDQIISELRSDPEHRD